jgi:hypothetical protein
MLSGVITFLCGPPVTVATLLSSLAIATEPLPSTLEVAPTCTPDPPSDTLTSVPFEGEEDESDGFADATHGVAAIPAPMPRATANAPTRPIYLAYPIIIVVPVP